MAKISFTNKHTAEAFENDEKMSFEVFSKVAVDLGLGRKLFNSKGEEVSIKDANEKIRAKFNEILGIEEGTKGRELRRAFRRHMIDLFEVTEDILADLVLTGWGDNPFFEQFVEIKNGALGETNEFYTEDKVILTVSEVSNGHHNLFRQRLGEGTSFPVKVSKYGVKSSSLAA